ncbi:unnamed protein product [Mytilus coruscus]|uniref:DUF1758 domain-containing protein n=1 Tax=Mytilus coruscus TaxID=42192 RepID=A0A6J8BMJ9_MYTCO|nr:unnamed protein product [Mytilus coruscus]
MDSKLKSVSAGHKKVVTKLLVKFDELKSNTNTEVDEVKALDDAVTQKQKTLIDLNNRLLDQTSEITDSDDYMYELDCKLRQIRKFIKFLETNTKTSHDNVDPSSSRLNPNAYNFMPEVRVDMNTCTIDSMKEQYSIHAPAVHTRPSENIMYQVPSDPRSSKSNYHRLPKSHRVSTCSSIKRCKKCSGIHHTSICKRKDVIPGTTPSAIKVVETTDDTSVMHSTQQSQDILLKKATAPAIYNNQEVECNILFDEGAQRSFTTQKLADKLEIKPTGKVSIYLSAFGELSQNVRNLDTTTIQLQTDTGEKVRINTLIVPQIVVPIQNKISQTTRSLPHLSGLKLKLKNCFSRHSTVSEQISTVVGLVITVFTPIVGGVVITETLMTTICKEMDRTPTCNENLQKLEKYKKAVND